MLQHHADLAQLVDQLSIVYVFGLHCCEAFANPAPCPCCTLPVLRANLRHELLHPGIMFCFCSRC